MKFCLQFFPGLLVSRRPTFTDLSAPSIYRVARGSVITIKQRPEQGVSRSHVLGLQGGKSRSRSRNGPYLPNPVRPVRPSPCATFKLRAVTAWNLLVAFLAIHLDAPGRGPIGECFNTHSTIRDAPEQKQCTIDVKSTVVSLIICILELPFSALDSKYPMLQDAGVTVPISSMSSPRSWFCRHDSLQRRSRVSALARLVIRGF